MRAFFVMVLGLVAWPTFAATPTVEAFRGTNEVLVSSNVLNNRIIIGPATRISVTASNAAQTIANAASNALFSIFSANNLITSNGAANFTLTTSNSLVSQYLNADITTSNGAVSFAMTVSNALASLVGESNYNGEISVTNSSRFGWVYGKDGITNLLRSFQPAYGLNGTNESGTNISLAIDPAIVVQQSDLTSASNALVSLLIVNDTLTSNGAVSFTLTTSNSLRTSFLASDITTSNGAVAFTMTASNTLHSDFVSNDTTTSNGLVTLLVANDTTTSNTLRTDIGNLQGGTNGLNTRVSNLEGSSNLTTYALVSSTTFLTNWANAISNYVTAATNSASVTNWINDRQPATSAGSNIVGLADTTFTNVPLGGTNISLRRAGGTNFFDTTGNLNNWSQIATGEMANVVSANFLTNWANAISNSVVANDTTTSNALRSTFIANDTTTSNGLVTLLVANDTTTSNGLVTLLVANDTTTSNALNTAIVAATNSASVTNWINFRQAASAVLSNIVGMASFYWTNSQASSMVLSNIVGMASLYWTNGQASAMLLSNLVNNPYVAYTNVLTKTATTVSGAGNGNTNYLLTLSTNSVNYFYLGSSNVNIYTVGGSTLGSPILWTAIVTNLSANTWGFTIASGTNRWRWYHPVYGTNRPITLTNNTALCLQGQSDGTNTLVSYYYFAPGL